jgi:hypothetical protein
MAEHDGLEELLDVFLELRSKIQIKYLEVQG